MNNSNTACLLITDVGTYHSPAWATALYKQADGDRRKSETKLALGALKAFRELDLQLYQRGRSLKDLEVGF